MIILNDFKTLIDELVSEVLVAHAEVRNDSLIEVCVWITL